MPSTEHLDRWLEQALISRAQHSAAVNLLEDEAAAMSQAKRLPKRNQGRGQPGFSFANAQADRYRHAMEAIDDGMRDVVVRAVVHGEALAVIAASEQGTEADVMAWVRFALTRLAMFYAGRDAA